MEENNNDEQYFELFLKLYKEKKLFISWRQRSFSIPIKDEAKNEIMSIDKDNIYKFKEFIENFINALRKKVINGKNDEYYNKYVDILLKEDSHIESDILTRCTSNMNICNLISTEILTKRDKELNIKCFSALINLTLQEPNTEQDNLEQISFELSERDIETLYKELDNIKTKIGKLKVERQKNE